MQRAIRTIVKENWSAKPKRVTTWRERWGSWSNLPAVAISLTNLRCWEIKINRTLLTAIHPSIQNRQSSITNIIPINRQVSTSKPNPIVKLASVIALKCNCWLEAKDSTGWDFKIREEWINCSRHIVNSQAR